MIGQLNLAVWAWAESLRGLRTRAVLVPFLVLAGIQALLLLAMTQFYQPFLSWLLVPLVRAAGGGSGALHYPQFYLVLPSAFSRLSVIMDFVLGTFFIGVGFLWIWRSASGLPEGRPWKEVWREYLRLILLRLPVVLVLLLIYELVPRLLGGELRGNTLRLFRYGSFFLAAVTEWIFLFTPLALLAQGRSIRGSFRESFAMLGRAPLAGFLIVFVPNLVQLPLSAVMRRTDAVIRNLAPETVGWILLATVLITMAVNYIVVASAVRVFGARSGAVEGAR